MLTLLAGLLLPIAQATSGCMCSVAGNAKSCQGGSTGCRPGGTDFMGNPVDPWCEQASTCLHSNSMSSYSGPCFSKKLTTACKLIDAAAATIAAYDACYKGTTEDGGVAKVVMMATLAVGDTVLTATTGGGLATTRVVVNQHASADHTSKMLTLHTADGTKLSLTPDHAIFVDGALAAAAEAKVGATLTRADGTAVKIVRVAEADAAAVISPVTTSGTILASDADSRGEPLLASSHLMLFAPLYKYAASRAAANAALYVVGDVTNWTEFVATLLAKLGTALAVAAVASKALSAAK